MPVFLNSYALNQGYSFPWWLIFYSSLVEFSTGTSTFWHFKPSLGNNPICLEKIKDRNLTFNKTIYNALCPDSRNSPELCYGDFSGSFWNGCQVASVILAYAGSADQFLLWLQIEVNYFLLLDTLQET